ncbi:Lipoprotein-anchoring transpeptidase ErfK/SrfK [Rubritalea squalenifaciens DSM 18772]|uniref:Lipoprotein-anchoring transpeptidase ErfK/SrfK n=1 Tax=Rubritalea squalenifaciens DSM 18772 TaxID=1123071 RepID=A0A1M6R9T9_9BACT|nr:L,D-transpeptidase family protein [Rubritalea squalenifaciens]SHK29243.1 Lipoprotein-anchoring transpeptidase ErfK/SrfK [Rubritalea squalenifaciens DSM 18772]
MKKITILLLSLCAALLSSCMHYDYYGSSSIYGGSDYLSGFNDPRVNRGLTHHGKPAPRGYWDGDSLTGSPKIVIRLADQRAYFYKGGQLAGVTPISTGTDGHSTPRGSFRVTEKDIDHVSSLYGVIKNTTTGQVVNKDADTRKHKAGPGEVFERAPMAYFLRFNGAIGMHAGFLPGYPASHGCVRLPEEMARIYFHNAPMGTPVIVE